MLNKTLLPSLLGFALASGVAVASPEDYEEHYYERGPMPFEALDLNGDGVVTADEHAKARSERQAARAKAGYQMRNAGKAPAFDVIDSDGSGSISNDEWSNWKSNHCDKPMGKRRYDD